MAEEEVKYASVVFKSKKPQSEAKEREGTVYDEVKVHNEYTETQDTGAGILSHKKAERCRRLAWCFGTLCAILVLGIAGVCVYYVSELNQLKANYTTLLGESHNLTNINKKLRSDYDNLTKIHINQTFQVDNLTQALEVREHKMTNLTAENQMLLSQNEMFKEQNQNLETEKKLLTKQIEEMSTQQNELNVSRAQWSIDAYCPKMSERRCQSCQDGWLHHQSSCYAYNNHLRLNQRSWEGAREDCRGKSSDLSVVLETQKKEYINSISVSETDITGYWIGLRAEGGKWKWIDGTDLTNKAWIASPTYDGQCVVSLQNQEWKSVSCNDKNAWICEKKALSV